MLCRGSTLIPKESNSLVAFELNKKSTQHDASKRIQTTIVLLTYGIIIAGIADTARSGGRTNKSKTENSIVEVAVGEHVRKALRRPLATFTKVLEVRAGVSVRASRNRVAITGAIKHCDASDQKGESSLAAKVRCLINRVDCSHTIDHG
jgi:hypothetical protein